MERKKQSETKQQSGDADDSGGGGVTRRGGFGRTGKEANASKPTMLGVRISPKTQYGLRLLARVQDKSISDAVEWAINLAMRSTRIGAGLDETRLAKVVDRVWAMPTEAQRIYELYTSAPELLTFDERAAWGFVRRCKDLWETIHLGKVHVGSDEDGVPEFDYVIVPESEAEHSKERPIFELIEKHWDQLRATGVALAHVGEIEESYSLRDVLSGAALRRHGIE